jgi:nucleotide-binding universal stress UspA family protein
MYRCVLLAYDGTVEGRAALREGALIAKRFGSEVHLLSVISESVGLHVAETANAGAIALVQNRYQAILDDGADRLRQIGFKPHARLVVGEPARVIGACARQIGADLVVVGHRRQSLLERWWSGSSGGYLVDHLNCTLVISRNTMSDEDFLAELNRTTGARVR